MANDAVGQYQQSKKHDAQDYADFNTGLRGAY